MTSEGKKLAQGIEQGIDAERLRIRRQGRRQAMVVVAGIVLCVFAFVAVDRIPFSIFHEQEKTSKRSLPPTLPEAVPDGEAFSFANDEQKRNHFKEILQSLETELEPQLRKAAISVWAAADKVRLEEGKAHALRAYAEGDYHTAVTYLEKAAQAAKNVLAKQQRILADAMQKALESYGQDDHRTALLMIENALRVAPSDPSARALKGKINALPKVLKKIQAANAARAENDPAKELGILREIKKLAPQRADIVARAATLEERIRKKQFAQAMAEGLKASQNGNISAARAALQKARALFPKRDEIALLSSHVTTLERKNRIANLIADAHRAMAADDWDGVGEKLSKAQSMEPNNKDVLDGLARAHAIVTLKAEIAAFEQKPFRLSTTVVRDAAHQAVAAARTMRGESPSLSAAAKRLSMVLALANRAVPVQVISDAKTFVQVRAVGKVGPVREKTIQLKPGRYTFEGLREGYKSKLITVDIPLKGPVPTVEVICDEPT